MGNKIWQKEGWAWAVVVKVPLSAPFTAWPQP